MSIDMQQKKPYVTQVYRYQIQYEAIWGYQIDARYKNILEYE